MCSRSSWARKPHTAMVTSPLTACVKTGKKSTFGRVVSQLTNPLPSTQGPGMPKRGPWAATPVAEIKLVVERFSETDLAGR